MSNYGNLKVHVGICAVNSMPTSSLYQHHPIPISLQTLQVPLLEAEAADDKAEPPFTQQVGLPSCQFSDLPMRCHRMRKNDDLVTLLSCAWVLV